MRSTFNLFIRISKLLIGAFMILIGSLGILINWHDWFFLFLNVIFLGIGVVLFLTPISAKNTT